MRRKDGRPKAKARKTLPTFDFGFRDHPATRGYRHPTWDGIRTPGHYSVVSLFAGCGGLDLGVAGGFRFLGKLLPSLPFDIITAVDNLPDAIDTYKLNLGAHALLADLTAVKASDLPAADVLMGGFPCQDFSSSGPKVGFAGKRGQLYRVLSEYMAHHRPKLVIGENVPHLARLNGGIYLQTILREFEREGYRFDVWDLYAPDYGLPQSRRRLFLIGVRDDIVGYPVCPKPTHHGSRVSVDVALKDLEPIEDETVPNQGQFYVASRATAGGGQGDHTNQIGNVAYCIRANARGRIQFHYSLPRRLTVRECARLQAFPDEFVFPFTTQRNLTLIGNAVPPLLAFHVASAVSQFLQSSQTDTPARDRKKAADEPFPISLTRAHAEQLTLFSGSSGKRTL